LWFSFFIKSEPALKSWEHHLCSTPKHVANPGISSRTAHSSPYSKGVRTSPLEARATWFDLVDLRPGDRKSRCFAARNDIRLSMSGLRAKSLCQGALKRSLPRCDQGRQLARRRPFAFARTPRFGHPNSRGKEIPGLQLTQGFQHCRRVQGKFKPTSEAPEPQSVGGESSRQRRRPSEGRWRKPRKDA
jgi:hypothetical protein